jgi:pyruvate dehydrogenase (quinone)
VLYEAITDPEVPPLPPHIRLEQAQKLAKALPGDPHAGRIIKESVKGKIEEFVTR